ncbi:disulfide bond formation protein B [Methylocella sp.]|uniref:disulfide bond formation protein B n=1 Tax=Methylocella sp. TaxID=1978226 RepID=UPI0035B0C7EF
MQALRPSLRLDPARAGALVFAAAALTLAGAWIFEAMGYAPCELCLKQRIPYYVGVPLAGAAFGLARSGFPRPARWLLAALAALFAASALFGAYHAGVEWGFWPGPADCTGKLDGAGSVEDFLTQLRSVKVVRCDAPALHVLGLSLAVWNAAISAALALVAGLGATRALAAPQEGAGAGRAP